jgi:hypothetical protein
LKALTIIFYSFIIIACGGNSSKTTTNIPKTDSSYFEGVYADFQLHNGLIDEAYISIDSDGYATHYNYVGDAVDNFANCYVKTFLFQITSHDKDDEFYLSGPRVTRGATYNLYVNSKSFSMETNQGILNFPRTELPSSSFSPEC